MTIRWHPPLDRVCGPETRVDLPAPAPVGAVLRDLVGREPALGRYVRWDGASDRPWGVLVWRGGRLLGPSDAVEPGDEIEILALVTGG